MGRIYDFPLMGQFREEWEEMLESCSAILAEILETVEKVDVFTALGMSIQVDAVTSDYTFFYRGTGYRLAFVLPFSSATGIFSSASLFAETTFVAGREFQTHEDLRDNFVPWFENLPFWRY